MAPKPAQIPDDLGHSNAVMLACFFVECLFTSGADEKLKLIGRRPHACYVATPAHEPVPTDTRCGTARVGPPDGDRVDLADAAHEIGPYTG